MWCALRADDVAKRGNAPAAGGVAMRGCVPAASGVGYAEVTAAQQPSPTLRVLYLAHRATSLPPGIFTFKVSQE